MELLMGNEAMAVGALKAGVNLVTGYPGTPSTEILETVAKRKTETTYVEWSVNEKTALEIAAGASYAGARTLVTMKQVGLNVALDPLMSLAYVGIKGGMVIVVADDPGPISSQTEQDTRHMAQVIKIPVLDPSSPEEAYEMMQAAFLLSEQYETPVILRPTTRVCHACAGIDTSTEARIHQPEGFVKDSSRWVIFPRASYLNHIKIEQRNPKIGEQFSTSSFNSFWGHGPLGIACGGINYAYVREAIELLGIKKEEVTVCKIGTPFPFPEALGLQFLHQVEQVLCVEELDPVIETNLIFLCGKHGITHNINGKINQVTPLAGENCVENVARLLADYVGKTKTQEALVSSPSLPIRPPVLCAGCPHRASFYAVKDAMRGKKAVFAGDIGCYTLGNAKPLDMVDTCLCMGADVTIAQGLHRIEPDTTHFSFIGDSTFFASGITGVVNAIYNQTDIVLIVLDNSTTAMTGHQPHPGTGNTMMGAITEKISIEKVLEALGVNGIQIVDPLDLKAAKQAVLEASAKKGVKAIIFKSPCIAVVKPQVNFKVEQEKCIQCNQCIQKLGCPAIVRKENQIYIEKALCYGCTLCSQVCPVGAIQRESGE